MRSPCAGTFSVYLVSNIQSLDLADATISLTSVAPAACAGPLSSLGPVVGQGRIVWRRRTWHQLVSDELWEALGLLDVVTQEVGLEGSDRQPVFTAPTAMS